MDVASLLQVFRALKPTLSSEACNALMAGLAKCLASPSKISLEVAADVILTLQVCCNLSGSRKVYICHTVCLLQAALCSAVSTVTSMVASNHLVT